MGIFTSADMRRLEFGDALNRSIDRLIGLVQRIGVYNDSATGMPTDETEDSGFEAVCSLLNELADVANWSSELREFEETIAILATCLDELDNQAVVVLDAFGVAELCEGGHAVGEFWFRQETDEQNRQISFGGRWKESIISGGTRWMEVNDKTPPHRAEHVKPRVTLFENVEQFVGVDDTPFLEILNDILGFWRKNRPIERLGVHVEIPRTSGAQSPDLFVPPPLQSAILKALDGKALKKQALADVVSKGEGSRLYRPGGLKELMAMGKVRHTRGRGYYRPDSPPPDAELIAPLQQPQRVTRRSPTGSDG
jgi:hypothetical protein